VVGFHDAAETSRWAVNKSKSCNPSHHRLTAYVLDAYASSGFGTIDVCVICLTVLGDVAVVVPAVPVADALPELVF
jgi:hypothetical protein